MQSNGCILRHPNVQTLLIPSLTPLPARRPSTHVTDVTCPPALCTRYWNITCPEAVHTLLKHFLPPGCAHGADHVLGPLGVHQGHWKRGPAAAQHIVRFPDVRAGRPAGLPQVPHPGIRQGRAAGGAVLQAGLRFSAVRKGFRPVIFICGNIESD